MEESTEYEDEVELYGRVRALDKSNKTFRFHYIEGGKEKRVYANLDNMYESLIFNALEEEDDQKVFIRGTGNFENRQLQRIEMIDDFRLLDSRDIQFRLSDLKNLEDGWFENQGIAPSTEKLTKLSELFDLYYTEDEPLPYIYPTLDGNLELEWTINNVELILEIDLSSLIGNLLIIKGDKDSEYSLDLNFPSGWNELNDILKGVC